MVGQSRHALGGIIQRKTLFQVCGRKPSGETLKRSGFFVGLRPNENGTVLEFLLRGLSVESFGGRAPATGTRPLATGSSGGRCAASLPENGSGLSSKVHRNFL